MNQYLSKAYEAMQDKEEWTPALQEAVEKLHKKDPDKSEKNQRYWGSLFEALLYLQGTTDVK